MTLTFKDPNGVECRLLVSCYNSAESRIRERPATLADLLSALGQLSTGSDGPTDEELWRIDQAALAAVPDEASVRETNTAALRALFAAGFASRQAEVDRLTAELADEKRHSRNQRGELNRFNRQVRADYEAMPLRHQLESELAATKAKLAEGERRLDCEQDKVCAKAPGCARHWEERNRELVAEATSTKEKLAEVTAAREDDLTALSKSCNELSAALADRSELIEKLRKARRQRNEAVADAAVLRAKLAEVERSHAAAVKANEEGTVMLAEVERERDAHSQERQHEERRHLEALAEMDELNAAFMSLYSVAAHVARIARMDCEAARLNPAGVAKTLGEANGFALKAIRKVCPSYGTTPLASAGAEADRTEAPKSLREQAREKLAAMSDSQVSNLWVRLQHLEPEPPRPEAGESGPVCGWHPSNDDGFRGGPDCGAPATHLSCLPLDCTPTCAVHKCRCAKLLPTEEPKPEPQAMPDSVRAVIASRFRAGESVALLVNDYGRPTEQVEAAIRSEMPSVEEP